VGKGGAVEKVVEKVVLGHLGPDDYFWT